MAARDHSDMVLNEERELAALPAILDGAKLFIDVGAHKGAYTFAAMPHMQAGEIVAIEANPYLASALTDTVKQLPAGGGKAITVVNAAVCDKVGEIGFFFSEYAAGNSLVRKLDNSQLVTVPAITLNRFAGHEGKIVAKIDVEGAEYRVLVGASDLLNRRDVTLFMELHGWGDAEIRKYPLHVILFLLKRKFSIKKVGSNYLFEPAQSPFYWVSYVPVFPVIFAKFLLHTYLRPLRPVLNYAHKLGYFLRP